MSGAAAESSRSVPRPGTGRRDRRYRLSTRGPWILFVVVLALAVTLSILWHVALVSDYQKLRELAQDQPFHWPFMVLGSVLFLAIIILSSILGVQLISHIRWSQRQSNFIASVSHELNSPLSSIKLFAQTLRQNDMSPADRRDFVEKLLFDVERLKRLIANILRAAEIDHFEDLPLMTQRVELHGYLGNYRDDTLALRGEDELTLDIEGEPDIWVDLDPVLFRQVLDNLIDNAIRYRGEHPPRIRLRFLRRQFGIDLEVIDQGIGVPSSELPSLFDRFYQVTDHHALRGRHGTGIGLFVVRSIVQAHGGRVAAWSAGPGRGTEILIRLPHAAASERVKSGKTVKHETVRGQLEPHSAG